MNADKAAEELKVIRQLMEPVRYSTMSGLSAVLAGAAAVAGAWVDRAVGPAEAGRVNLAVWGGVFVAAFAAAVVLTRRREVRRDMPFWSEIKKRILLTILPPFAAGAGLSLAIAWGGWATDGPNAWGLIPAVWMLCYGLALWQVGLFSPPEVRWLGVAFLAAGLATATWGQAQPHWAMGIAFGGFHFVYGLIVWVRHGG